MLNGGERCNGSGSIYLGGSYAELGLWLWTGGLREDGGRCNGSGRIYLGGSYAELGLRTEL